MSLQYYEQTKSLSLNEIYNICIAYGDLHNFPRAKICMNVFLCKNIHNAFQSWVNIFPDEIQVYNSFTGKGKANI